MNPLIAPAQPYAPGFNRELLRGRVELRLRSGVAFEDIHARRCVRFGAARPASRVDGGALDATLRRFTSAFRVSRAYSSAARGMEPGYGHEGWDSVEEDTGLSRTFRVDLDPEADLLGLVDALRQLEAVESATPCYLCQAPFSMGRSLAPGDPEVFELVGAREALKMEPGDLAVIVAIIDSGVSAGHPELLDRVRPGADTVALMRDLISHGLRYSRGPSDPNDASDELGHGTGCASIIAARGLNIPPGLAGAAQVLPMRALSRVMMDGRDEPTAVGSIPDINAAVKLAVDLGAKVLNLSFGTPASALRRDDPVPHAPVIDYALRRGCVLVAASGNRGDHSLYYPACLPGVIAVGAVRQDRRPSRFSCRGRHVAICAPGEKIPCAGLDGYQYNTGTSFAAPFVAAAAALLVARAHRSAVPLDSYRVRDLLMKSASPFAAPADIRGCGAGVLNVPAALRLLDETNRGPPGMRLVSGWAGAGGPAHASSPQQVPALQPPQPAQPGAPS